MEFIYEVVNKDFLVDRRDPLTRKISQLTGLTIDEAVYLATKVFLVRYKNQDSEYYAEQLPDDPRKLLRHNYFNWLLDSKGSYMNKNALEFLLPDESDYLEPSRKEQKHKITRIRKRATEQYYGPWLSEYILSLTTTQIFNLIFYDFLNTRGRAKYK